jgi:hypothetical protein
MVYRNNAQINRLQKVLEAKGRPSTFVKSIIFENHAKTDQVGVSWHITPQELATLEEDLQRDHNQSQFRALETFWNETADETRTVTKPTDAESAATVLIDQAGDSQATGRAAAACGAGKAGLGSIALR